MSYDVDPMPGRTSELDKLELGRLLYERFIGPALDLPIPGPGEPGPQGMAENWLKALGFEQVEWFTNPRTPDITIVLLWYTRDGKVQEFGLEFGGGIVSVLDVSVSVPL